MDTRANVDALLPGEMAHKAESVGVKKAKMDAASTITLAVLAGAFIAFGAIFATTVTAGSGLPYGVSRLLAGTAFSLGLILVIVGGAELFTGNNLIVMAWASRRISTRAVIRNWALVYVGNFIGSVSLAVLVLMSGHYKFGNGAIGTSALNIALAKTQLAPLEAVVLGILCNVLVCLAVWLTFSARTTVDRILCIVPPIAAFVAAGFEHSVANMYFVPLGILIRGYAPAGFWETTGLQATQFADLTWSSFLINNLLPVTIGNIIGGAALVGVVYWFIYLRHDDHGKPGSPK